MKLCNLYKMQIMPSNITLTQLLSASYNVIVGAGFERRCKRDGELMFCLNLA